MYLGEFRLNWRSMLAAVVGMGLGSSLAHYTMSLFGPPLLAEFGWSKADFALLGSLPLINLLFMPFAGRLTDRFGTRIVAIVGFTAMPLGFIAFAMMSGSLVEFFAIWVVQHIFGVFTSTIVFCRLVVERFDRARGFALSLLMMAAPLSGAIAAPLLGGLIDSHGWRAGYLALGVLTAIGGLVAILMMDRTRDGVPPPGATRSLSRGELAGLLRHPTLLMFLGAMILVNVPTAFAGSQLKLILLDNGVTGATATWMVSLYALGVLVGRFLSGIALDRVAPHLVAMVALGLPAIGYAIFAAQLASVPLFALAILLVGFAQGAEADIGAFLLSRRFDMKNFSLLMSLMNAMIGVGGVIGSVVLSAGLRTADSYTPYLIVSTVTTLLGAILFTLAGARRPRHAAPHEDVEIAVARSGLAADVD